MTEHLTPNHFRHIRFLFPAYQRRLSFLRIVVPCIFAVALISLKSAAAPKPDQVIEYTPHEFGRRKDQNNGDRPRLDLHFGNISNATDSTLQIYHRDVMLPWAVLVNGRSVGHIGTSYKHSGQSHLSVPAGVLVDGENIVSIVGEAFATLGAPLLASTLHHLLAA